MPKLWDRDLTNKEFEDVMVCAERLGALMMLVGGIGTCWIRLAHNGSVGSWLFWPALLIFGEYIGMWVAQTRSPRIFFLP